MRKLLVIIASIGLLEIVLTCQKLDFDKVTKIETTSALTGLNSIKVKGNIIELSDDSHSEYGFCYSTNPSPTVNDNKVTVNNLQVGEFVSEIFGLNSDTKYYIRAFCKEGGSYIYGEVAEAKTCVVTLTDVENNTYNGVKIGDQVWMQENLKVTHYRNGDPIALNSDWALTTVGAYCWYSNEAPNKDVYGALYNYYTTIDNRNLCPVGWHIPSEGEWAMLSAYLGGDEISGGKMKEFGTLHWTEPNTDATNSSGFSAFPAGYRESDGAFNSLGVEGKWWSITTNDASTAVFRYIYNNYSTLFIESFPKSSGLSVRCIQGELASSPSVATSLMHDITSTTATGGGNITSDGGSLVTARGVCWSTSSNPTISNPHTTDGSGTGSFSSSMTGLILGTTYYVRAYATNSVGTAYGNQTSFVAISIGDIYQGGKVGYILQYGDPGFDENVTHGLVVANTDQSTLAEWGCKGTSISGADGSAIGTGNQNSIDIVSGCTTAGIAAKICLDLDMEGYTDWYLPSENELIKILTNASIIGGMSGIYWSSTEYDNNFAWAGIAGGAVSYYSKDATKANACYVRAIRSF